MRRIIIIGYMGAGKTTLGKALADHLKMTFYDLDWYIESRMHKTVKAIFDERGEEGFRKIEHNMLHEVAEFENVIISCGGGTPCFFDNMNYLNQQGETVYLKATPEILHKHLKMGKTIRPLLLNKTSDEIKLFIEQQLQQREPYYNRAKHVYEVQLMNNHTSIQRSVNALTNMLNISIQP